MSPLDRKLLRDLWRIKGQAAAIGVVIAVGVAMLVMMSGLVTSLVQTRDAYYDRYRLADIFAPATRAPDRLAHRMAAIDGVSAVEPRVTGSALVDLPGLDLPVQAQAVSLPDLSAPRVNDVFLTDGRMIDSDHADEILLLRSFARAHGLRPGDRISATMNGARHGFRIVGLAQSPEFLYTTAPGELIPDDARFGVLWMSRSALSAAYDMEGAFNEALLTLAHGANEAAVLDAVDRLLAPYGGTGAYPVADQTSNRFVSEEISGLEASSAAVPPIFLGVAAFLLYIVISRMVQSEREEIGLMKAFGYTDTEVGVHYFKLVMAVAVGGALAGCLLGIAGGRALVEVYVIYYKFPFLLFQLDPASFAAGVSVSILSASGGGLLVLRRVFLLTPAAAMRPPTPPDYSRAGNIGRALNAWLDQPSRMVLRRITRQPGRMAGAVIGIACGMALSASMITIYAAFDRTIDLTFNVMDRSDVTVSFTNALSDMAVFELRRDDSVILAEPRRHVPAVFRNGLNSHRGVITGIPPGARLGRALDSQQAEIPLPASGIVLSTALADILNVRPGDRLTVEMREGRQPTLQIPVTAVAESLLGAPAYMNLAALNRALGEPGRMSGVLLAIDRDRAPALYAALRNMPMVAGVSLKSEAEAAFLKTMNTGAGAIRYVMGAIAFVITFGIVYNAARIAHAERYRDLASLRVIGFTRAETAFVLLGELAVVTLAALPLGSLLGHYLSFAIAAGFSSELYQIPTIFDPPSHGFAAIVVIGAAAVSGWLVKRDIDRADLVSALKTRE
ncbi:FtsX-like permease family protein [Sedimentitalea sp. JM2-8]|uniref:FtsX-like permease family protein n=1 Tax=Sedimentitalea xiamensis TaxID=3050037 RepID=A0ABT7FFD3_9RHOB|nr:ABC transporter permease [Sedimentitalea xiamensis]MDK3073839.1 FtsX-like permease family protein [Sedimentitalea xiamensis]